jgi:hypothetical protein
VRTKSRSYVNTILWDTTRHGLHIKVSYRAPLEALGVILRNDTGHESAHERLGGEQVSKDGRVAKKQQSHWYSVAVGKDGYECAAPLLLAPTEHLACA